MLKSLIEYSVGGGGAHGAVLRVGTSEDLVRVGAEDEGEEKPRATYAAFL